jgi:hypothetical protein
MDFAIPFPLSPEETQREQLTAEAADQLARARARQASPWVAVRVPRMPQSHFSGGAIIDDPASGRLLEPNLTGGAGGRTAGFRPADWDRIVRHGVKPGGTPALMP